MYINKTQYIPYSDIPLYKLNILLNKHLTFETQAIIHTTMIQYNLNDKLF